MLIRSDMKIPRHSLREYIRIILDEKRKELERMRKSQNVFWADPHADNFSAPSFGVKAFRICFAKMRWITFFTCFAVQQGHLFSNILTFPGVNIKYLLIPTALLPYLGVGATCKKHDG